MSNIADRSPCDGAPATFHLDGTYSTQTRICCRVLWRYSVLTKRAKSGDLASPFATAMLDPFVSKLNDVPSSQ
jgi:hypothetical protein